MTSREIIKKVLRRHKVGPKDFFSATRMPHVVEARMAAACFLAANGFRTATIARAIQRNHSTILYYLDPEKRARKSARYYARRSASIPIVGGAMQIAEAS
jgi:chromosomal replication initiation ATPase DnaA